jgi:hypothetical protein
MNSCVVHRRLSTRLGALQSDSGISRLLRQDRVERLHGGEDVGGNVGGHGSSGVQTGRHGRGSRGLPYQATVSRPPIILLSVYCEMPERILWLVDEYVMKSEPPKRLMPIVARTAHPRRPASPTNGASAAWQRRKNNLLLAGQALGSVGFCRGGSRI